MSARDLILRVVHVNTKLQSQLHNSQSALGSFIRSLARWSSSSSYHPFPQSVRLVVPLSEVKPQQQFRRGKNHQIHCCFQRCRCCAVARWMTAKAVTAAAYETEFHTLQRWSSSFIYRRLTRVIRKSYRGNNIHYSRQQILNIIPILRNVIYEIKE